MKTLFTLMILFTSQTLPAGAAASDAEPRSFDMVLTGMSGQPPPATTSLALRKMIGQFVTDLDVARYLQLAPPAGGGFHVCLEPEQPNGYNDIVNALQTIAPGSSASWTVTLVSSCAGAMEKARPR